MRSIAQRVIDDFPHERPMLGVIGGELLVDCVLDSDGDYVEIGSGYGGSAIMAALAMDYANHPGTVYCIDPFSALNELAGFDWNLMVFWMNVRYFGVEQRIVPFKQHHPPFPASIHHHRFSVGLIDGNHTSPYPEQDFNALKDRVSDYLLFDNVEQSAVQDTVHHATTRQTPERGSSRCGPWFNGYAGHRWPSRANRWRPLSRGS